MVEHLLNEGWLQFLSSDSLGSLKETHTPTKEIIYQPFFWIHCQISEECDVAFFMPVASCSSPRKEEVMDETKQLTITVNS